VRRCSKRRAPRCATREWTVLIHIASLCRACRPVRNRLMA
jgi:hypothetical protein